MADPGRGFLAAQNRANAWAPRWRGPRLCPECRQPIDYESGKWMAVEITAASPGRASRHVIVCRACWRANHRARPGPPAARVVAELARLVGQAIDRRISLRFTRPAAWAEGRVAEPLAGGAEEVHAEDR